MLIRGDSSTAEQLAFRPADGGSNPTPLQFRCISPKDMRGLVERFHYSVLLPPGQSFCFGWYVDGSLYAAAQYGSFGAIMDVGKSMSHLTGLPLTSRNCVELKRLVRSEPRIEGDDARLSKFLALCHASLFENNGVELVFSFSDPEHNKFKTEFKIQNGAKKGISRVPYASGGIYAASGFVYGGKTASETHYFDQAKQLMIHRRIPYALLKKWSIDQTKLNPQFKALCESERTATQRRTGKKYPKITTEMKYRVAMQLLGEPKMTYDRYAKEILKLVPYKSTPKDRWYWSPRADWMKHLKEKFDWHVSNDGVWTTTTGERPKGLRAFHADQYLESIFEVERAA